MEAPNRRARQAALEAALAVGNLGENARWKIGKRDFPIAAEHFEKVIDAAIIAWLRSAGLMLEEMEASE